MPQDRIQLIKDAIEIETPKGLKDLKERLPEDISYEQLRWVLASMRVED